MLLFTVRYESWMIAGGHANSFRQHSHVHILEFQRFLHVKYLYKSADKVFW